MTLDDVDELVALDRDPGVMKYISGGQPTPPLEVEQAVRESIGHRWMAFEQSTAAFVGWFGLRRSADREVELGYRLRREVWGRGFATEGSRAVLAVAFTDLGATRVWGQTMAVNVASRRVMERCGMRYVRTFHGEWPEPIYGSELGDVEYEITNPGPMHSESVPTLDEPLVPQGNAEPSAVAREVLTEVVAIGAEVGRVTGRSLAGMYLHGSAVLGDFQRDSSDIDLLVVVNEGTSDTKVEETAAVLAAHRSTVASGLEASVVESSACAAPQEPWPFRAHIATDEQGTRIVRGAGHPGDPDLLLHYVVCREAAWAVVGPPPKEVFGEVPRDRVLAQTSVELRWAVDHADGEYAVLNACRALRYRDEGVVGSKTDAGRWALERSVEPALVRAALQARRDGFSFPLTSAAREWVLSVASALSAT